MSDPQGMAVDDDEDYYIPVELVIVTSQIGSNGFREVSRWPVPATRVGHAQLEAAHLVDDIE